MPIGQSEYTRINIRLILADIITHPKLKKIVNKGGLIYMEIIQRMYELPQVGILANNLLAQCLGNHGYYQVKHVP